MGRIYRCQSSGLRATVKTAHSRILKLPAMPIPPPPITYTCPACHWSKTAAQRCLDARRALQRLPALPPCAAGQKNGNAGSSHAGRLGGHAQASVVMGLNFSLCRRYAMAFQASPARLTPPFQSPRKLRRNPA